MEKILNKKILEEAVEYFKDNIGFNRLMKKMREKYYSFEREMPAQLL